MNKNPIIPFLLIIFLGVGLVFLLSSYGATDDGEDTADNGTEQQDGDNASSGDADGESVAKDNCSSCHGQDFSGGMGPALAGTGVDKETFVKDVRNGIEGTAMPAFSESQISDEEIDAIYEFFTK
ncbi:MULTISPECIES: c-type cytochrome [Nosocomiicoccus]|uniref:Cytochrome c n=1 Tax=Nosocomiicoccus massiliensis TaxID=1232430 RepID=A0AAF0YNI7_9STAP|nr:MULTISPECIES: cytochrome c [Nosocomiicoccus]OFO51364.1 hypothetical protein HMPREF3029_07310 [Nosocomiicoccus sp. HMSC059G07]WOS96452.1 cytochrome c [Nosocomiicoccus massiliensis]